MTRQVPIEFDKSNEACYITMAWIDYCGALDNTYEVLYDVVFPSLGAALAFFKPQIRGDWQQMKTGGFEADLLRNCAMNHGRPGQARAYHIRIINVVLMTAEDCVEPNATLEELVAEDR